MGIDQAKCMTKNVSLQEDGVLEYVESMLSQLHAMVSSQNEETLAYLIEMARIHAHDRIMLNARQSANGGHRPSDVAL